MSLNCLLNSYIIPFNQKVICNKNYKNFKMFYQLSTILHFHSNFSESKGLETMYLEEDVLPCHSQFLGHYWRGLTSTYQGTMVYPHFSVT